MTLARLLAFLLLTCSIAFAQVTPSNPLSQLTANHEGDKSITESRQPWQIFPDQEPETNLLLNPKSPLDTHNHGAFLFNPDLGQRTMTVLANSEHAADATCYAIRSYVVARDDKDSDSTHPVSSSTCQPARRYRLKNVPAQPVSSER